MTAVEFGSIDRASCPSCAKAVPRAAEICPECGEEIDAQAGTVPSLPQRHQSYFDFQTWEDSRIFVPLPSGSEAPGIEDIVERLGLGGIEVEILSANPPSTIGPDEAQWEFEFLATLEGVDVRQAWVADDYGIGYESGERYNMWLIRTPQALSGFDVLLGEAPVEAEELVEESEWTLGLNGYCSSDAAETFRFQITVARFAAGDEVPIIDETAGRFLDDARVQHIVRKKARFEDTYEVYTVRRDGEVWLHTGGVPRVGGFEVELLDISPDRVKEATSLLERAVPAFCDSDRPIPYRAHQLDERTEYLWLPMEDAEAFFPDALGTSARDRGRLIFPSAVLLTDRLHPDAFERARQAYGGSGRSQRAKESPEAQAWSDEAATSKVYQAREERLDQMRHQGRVSDATVVIAPLASFILPGVGQMIIGQVAKGLVLLFLAMALALFTCGISLIFHPIFAIDAYLLADKARSGQKIGDWDFF
jgi:TM2 domain-containing membrane protein YozV